MSTLTSPEVRGDTMYSSQQKPASVGVKERAGGEYAGRTLKGGGTAKMSHATEAITVGL